ncbi:MAG: tetratricopeptide repeat protein, partial [Actinomycetota bacterium]
VHPASTKGGMVRRIIGAGAVAATLFVLGAVRPGPGDVPSSIRIPDPGALAGRVTGGSVAPTIEYLGKRLRDVPSDWRAAAALGLAHVQEARITADPGHYPRAEAALRRSLSQRPGNIDAVVGMGSLALARHEFHDALVWGRRAVAANPDASAGYGVVGDALVELGRYREAFRYFQRMVDLRPGLSSYARASHARELQGDVAGALRLMRMAEAAAGSPQDAAWAAFELGELSWSVGRVDSAAASYRRAARLSPSFVPPRAGLARVSWARGRLPEAIRRYRWVLDRYPAPEHVAALGDLYEAVGRADLARDQYALVRAEQALLETNRVNVDLELALFDADHGRPGDALRSARAAWAARKSVHAADALAWALYRNGRSREAADYARRALALGTSSAPFLFHAGMIELRLGHEGRAHRLLSEALRTNPRFSILHARTAHRALGRLGARA